MQSSALTPACNVMRSIAGRERGYNISEFIRFTLSLCVMAGPVNHMLHDAQSPAGGKAGWNILSDFRGGAEQSNHGPYISGSLAALEADCQMSFHKFNLAGLKLAGSAGVIKQERPDGQAVRFRAFLFLFFAIFHIALVFFSSSASFLIAKWRM